MPPHHRRQSRGVSIERAKRPLDGRKKRKTVGVVIPIDRHAAAVLKDERNRAAIGRLISRMLRPGSKPSPLTRVIAAMKAEARDACVTDEDIEAELVAYDAAPQGRKSR